MVSPGSGMPAFSASSVAATAQYPYCTTAFRKESRMEWVMLKLKFSSAGVSPAVARASRPRSRWKESSFYDLSLQKLDQHPVEFLRTLFIGQMPHAGENDFLHIRKVARQRFH